MGRGTLFAFILLSATSMVYGLIGQDEFSWRDYDGKVPTDAFQVGIDKKGPVYIGQVLYQGKIIPGKIYAGDEHIYIENQQKPEKLKNNVKIFCTKNPKSFVWEFTKNSDYKRIKGDNLIIGGFEQGYKTHIGAIIDKGEAIVGKVICKESECVGFYAEKDGKSVSFHKSYYVLKYSRSNATV